MSKAPAILMVLPTAARKNRIAAAKQQEIPREFFYGYLLLKETGANVSLGDSRITTDQFVDRFTRSFARLRNSASKLGLAGPQVRALGNELSSADIVLSFTDSFSLSLGLYRSTIRGDAILGGGFHGLADLVDRVRPSFRRWALRKIRKGLEGLDHVFFFGEADRLESIRRYDLSPEKTSLFRFGVDTDFWRPGTADLNEARFVLSVGSDPKRDYATLISAKIDSPTKIITRLPVFVPPSAPNIQLIRGSYHDTEIDDLLLRDIYRASDVVVVPIRDFYQPSGYSVTLQAMACGKPVVLSRIKGLWDPAVFESGVNCVLVEPENPAALREATSRLLADPELRDSIGRAARETAIRQFSISRMDESLAHMVAALSLHPNGNQRSK